MAGALPPHRKSNLSSTVPVRANLAQGWRGFLGSPHRHTEWREQQRPRRTKTHSRGQQRRERRPGGRELVCGRRTKVRTQSLPTGGGADHGVLSGISVQNPNARGNVPGGDLVRDLLRRAAE